MALAKLPIARDSIATPESLPTPVPPRSRGWRLKRRLATVVTTCAMGSWVVLGVVPVVVLISWLARITHL